MVEVAPLAVEEVHMLLAQVLKEGDRVIDATCGRGNDTLFMAGLVGKTGRVYAFDLQAEACRDTALLLAREGLAEQVQIWQEDHARVKEFVQEPVCAVVFNLGYLPGGNHTIITKPASTVQALDNCLDLLTPGGIVFITSYIGHSGGLEEAAAIEEYCQKLSPNQWYVIRKKVINKKNAPELYLIQKREGERFGNEKS